MTELKEHSEKYRASLKKVLDDLDLDNLQLLLNSILECWKNDNTIYVCGNGGSAGNANHIANDLLYGAGLTNGLGIHIESLSVNPSVITCLANDVGFEKIYSEQIKVKGKKNDLLIVLSGSGNSKNVINAIEEADKKQMNTFSLLGIDGGVCKKISKNYLHFNINDMQISEDMQLIVLHMCSQILSKKKIK